MVGRRSSNMEISLAISIVMLLVILVSFSYMLKELKECQKIIKSMKRRSKKYMKEVVSND
tara:strand:+ start:438 stop:617 length:180 start_codon:yes stop_codon:yes gene_type:complete